LREKERERERERAREHVCVWGRLMHIGRYANLGDWKVMRTFRTPYNIAFPCPLSSQDLRVSTKGQFLMILVDNDNQDAS
jgi:hypothetical protein